MASFLTEKAINCLFRRRHGGFSNPSAVPVWNKTLNETAALVRIFYRKLAFHSATKPISVQHNLVFVAVLKCLVLS